MLTLRGKFSALPWEQGSSGRQQAAPQVMLTSRTRSSWRDQHPFHGKSLEHSAAARPFPLPPSRLSWKGKAAVSVDVTYVVLRDAQPRCSGGSSSPEPCWWRAAGSCPLPASPLFPPGLSVLSWKRRGEGRGKGLAIILAASLRVSSRQQAATG